MMIFSRYSSDYQGLDYFLTVIGLVVSIKLAFSTVVDIIVGFRALVWSRMWKKDFTKRYDGKWAVITGSSDGIGKGYAYEFAKDGLNIVLISHKRDELEAVASDIESKYAVVTEIVLVDFMDGDKIYPKIASHLKDKSIAILVNNVGTLTLPPKYFAENLDSEVQAAVFVNMLPVVRMTKLVLPQMIRRNKGAIVNISSIVSLAPAPVNALYGASKAFVSSFSEALEWECRGTGISVQTVCPSVVTTKLVSFSKMFRTPSQFC